jgi:SAM-dependent methyltransferase
VPWKPTSKKRQTAPEDRAALHQLSKVRRQRQPFERLSRKIIGDTLARYLPDIGLVVEIGMGDGQLRERLPASILPRLVHTEPQAAASREFRKEQPDVKVIQASAEHLPFADGEIAAVLGLCVLDVLKDGRAVASELRRVLAPAGRVIHWLDMSTTLDQVIAALAGTGLVPLPNVFTDPMAAASPAGAPGEHPKGWDFPGSWPEDMFLVPRAELVAIAEVLAARSQALGRPLQQYLAVFSRVPFEPRSAIAEYVQLQESSSIRDALRAMFRTAYELAGPELRQRLAGFQGRPVSSARHFESRLKSWFDADAGFEIELSEVVAAWELQSRGDSPFNYMSSSVGEQRSLPRIPDALLCSDANVSSSDMLLELGTFVFVARRN